jgi:hypothetical protein
VKEFPKDFTLVDCLEEETLLAPEIIHKKVWKIVNKIL